MIELTENAAKELKAYFTDKEVSPIRVFLAPGGGSGPRLSLALDDTDETFQIDDFSFIIEKDLLSQAAPIKIDVTYMGFVVQSDMQLGMGGSCSTGSCSSGSCSC